MTTFRVATCNARKELSPREASTVINLAASRADILLFQEIETRGHKDAIHALERNGWDVYWPRFAANAVPVAWRKDRFRQVHKNKLRITKGRAGVTPNRYVVNVALVDKATGLEFGLVNTHLISQAFTSHPERRPTWNVAARLVADKAQDVLRYRGAVIGGGDMNRDRWAPAGTTGAWTAHGTHGSEHYDTLFYAGKVKIVDGPTRYALGNPSDHDLLVAEFEVTKTAPSKPKPPAAKPPKMFKPPAPPFIAARWFGGRQTPRTIVIHGTASPTVRGGARATAKFFANRPASGKTSAHYSVDPGEVIQSVGDHSVAYHCGHNQDSIGIELCDPQAGFGARWADADHKPMLARAATLVAELCLAYDIPDVRIQPSGLVAGKHGICGHVDMSNAFHASTHTDPGPDFPWTEFIHQVKAEISRLKKG